MTGLFFGQLTVVRHLDYMAECRSSNTAIDGNSFTDK